VQTKRIIRITLILFFITGIFCAGAIAVGASYPTTRIVAQIYSPSEDRQYLALIDMNRNLPIQVNFPVTFPNNVLVSADGRRFILPTGALNQATLLLWELLTGKMVALPQEYVNCSALNWQWLHDNRHVLFQCRDNPQDGTIGGMYTFDFETGNVYPLYSNPSVIMSHQWSPDNRRVAINDDGKVLIAGVQGDNLTTITPQGRRFTFVAWLPDGESVLLRGRSTIERYTFSTGELEVILDEFEANSEPVLSPDGAWLALVTSERRPRAYAFNLATSELNPLETTELKINNVVWVGWSPDSQWVMIRTLIESRDGNFYYLARPDAAVVTLLAENIDAIPVWSADSTRVSYSIYDEMDTTYYSELAVWDVSSFLPPQTILPHGQFPQWSPDDTVLAFLESPNALGSIRRLGYYTAQGGVQFLTNEDSSVVGFIFVK
jgi:Tol biopolymer transport system component